MKKYGQDFAAAAARNVDGCVNERVIQKLSVQVRCFYSYFVRRSACPDSSLTTFCVQPPSAYLVVNYMKEIAKQFKVEWEPDEQAVVDPLAPIPAPTGMSVASAGVSGPDYVALYTTVRESVFLYLRWCRDGRSLVCSCGRFQLHAGASSKSAASALRSTD